MKKILFLLLLAFSSLTWSQVSNINISAWVVLLGDQKNRFREEYIADIAGKTIEKSGSKFDAGEHTEAKKLGLLGYTLTEYISDSARVNRLPKLESKKLKDDLDKLRKLLLGIGITPYDMEVSKNNLNSYMHLYKISAQRPPLGWLDVVGIYPGYSLKEDVNSIKSNLGQVHIGGYRILCVDEYSEKNVILQLFCFFGKDDATTNESIPGVVFSSNDEVFDVLSTGFTKKFGKPKTSSKQLQNQFGLKIASNTLTWVDKFGNELNVMSTMGKAGRGSLVLSSKEYLNAQKIKSNTENSNREF